MHERLAIRVVGSQQIRMDLRQRRFRVESEREKRPRRRMLHFGRGPGPPEAQMHSLGKPLKRWRPHPFESIVLRPLKSESLSDEWNSVRADGHQTGIRFQCG